MVAALYTNAENKNTLHKIKSCTSKARHDISIYN